ncbi:hypothetical protein FGG08_002024 [Glutinoglossum americanum]|uniref:Methylated-DNA-[protein]-cysteine S-methyltransferase DNA binding domain-containing protein n=1 Tax=Glutinoglossum americanum TaxID=1670608 RepID=A0A9P8L4V1_9PEZI|nr:hypothetical protein FGG08_002024 [Glutinoglossum americanum]
MARTDEAEAFFTAVYLACQEIPRGRVTSYGHIGRLIGKPECPRQVGICLRHLPTDPDAEFNSDSVPWQRVINSRGVISPRRHSSGASRQATALEQEGVAVERGSLGELKVDLEVYGWFPRRLPSREDDGDYSDELEGDEE